MKALFSELIWLLIQSFISGNYFEFSSSYCPYTSSDVVRIKAQTVGQLRQLEQLILSYKAIDGSETIEWLSPNRVGMPALYMTRSSMAEYLVAEAKSLGLEANIAMRNVQKSLMEPNFTDPSGRHVKFLQGYPEQRYTVNEYHPLDEIYHYLDALEAKYRRLCQVEEIGLSYEGRPIRLIKIGNNLETSPIIFIDAAMHAREWLSTSTAIFIASQLITQYDNDPNIKSLVDNITWYILPVVNVDGYNFTWTKDRKWRQNRSPPRVCISENCLCRGTDLNRNWDSRWNTTGSCDHPCCETYPGSAAMSELEVQHESRIMQSLGPRLRSYVSFHAYGQLWTYPYNYKRKAYPPDVKELRQVAEMAVKAVENVHGKKYQIGTGADLLYLSSGCSTDWAKEHLGVKYTYLIELFPPIFDRRYGFGHFCPNSSVIIPTGESIFAGVKVVADAVLGNFDFNISNSAGSLRRHWTEMHILILWANLGYYFVIYFGIFLFVMI